MTAWIGLLKKDYRIVRTVGLGLSLGMLLYFVGLFIAAWRYSPDQIAFFSVLPIGFGVWWVTVFLMTSLEEERKKLYLWLHNPQSGWMLLGAKMIVAMGVSMVVIVINLIGIQVFFSFFVPIDELLIFTEWPVYVSILIGLLIVSSYIASWFMCGWTVFHWLSRFFGKASLIVTLGLMGGLMILLFKIGASAWFGQLAQGIGYSFEIPMGIEMSVDGSDGSFEFIMNSERIYLLHLLFHIGIISSLFALSSRLVDRAVEV